MSQQTTLVVVLARFVSFIETLPNVQSLKNCSDAELKRLWAGLGYYARARNLRKGAEHIMDVCGGEFPRTFDGWRAVPGCGEYTAGMLASICFGERVPAVDGNVMRVAARVMGMGLETWQSAGKKRIHEFASQLVREASHAGDCNQALIELGALVCRKHNPDCVQCPFRDACVAHKRQITGTCPPPKPRREQEDHDLFPIVIQKKGRLATFLRTKGFLKGTRGFPLVHTEVRLRPFLACAEFKNRRAFAHVITHHNLTVEPKFASVNEAEWKSLMPNLRMAGVTEVTWVDENSIEESLQTALDSKAWNTVKLLT